MIEDATTWTVAAVSLGFGVAQAFCPIPGFARIPWTIHAVSRQWHMKMTGRYTENTTNAKHAGMEGCFFACLGEYCILLHSENVLIVDIGIWQEQISDTRGLLKDQAKALWSRRILL